MSLAQAMFFQTVSLFLAIGILWSTAFGFPSIHFVFNIVPAVGSVRCSTNSPCRNLTCFFLQRNGFFTFVFDVLLRTAFFSALSKCHF